MVSRQREWQKLHPEKHAAAQAVQNALKAGKLVKIPCEVCGKATDVEAHHTDYNKPLEVVWLCPACHKFRHPPRRNKGLGAEIQDSPEDAGKRNHWTRLADDAIEAAFGLGVRLHFLRPEQGRCVAYVEQHNDEGGRTVLAIAGGSDHGEACRALIQQCYRDDHRPITMEVATVLGVDDSRVRHMVAEGKLAPANQGKPMRFEASAVYEIISSH